MRRDWNCLWDGMRLNINVLYQIPCPVSREMVIAHPRLLLVTSVASGLQHYNHATVLILFWGLFLSSQHALHADEFPILPWGENEVM